MIRIITQKKDKWPIRNIHLQLADTTTIIPPKHTIGPNRTNGASGIGTGTGEIIPPDPTQLLEDSLRKAEQISRVLEDYTQPGNLLWQIPEDMKVDQESQVIVRIIRDTTTGNLTIGIDTAEAPVNIHPILNHQPDAGLSQWRPHSVPHYTAGQ